MAAVAHQLLGEAQAEERKARQQPDAGQLEVRSGTWNEKYSTNHFSI
jgi:hypothetical protein